MPPQSPSPSLGSAVPPRVSQSSALSHDDNREGNGSEAHHLVKKRPQARIDVSGQSFDTVQAAADYILSLPLEKQFPAGQAALQKLYILANSREEQLVDLFTLLEQRRFYESVGLSHIQFNQNNQQVVAKVRELRSTIEAKRTAFSRLQATLQSSKRGTSLWETIDRDEGISSKGFGESLAQLFKAVTSAEEGIIRLNNEIIKHHNKPTTQGSHGRAGLRLSDVTAAISMLKSKKKMRGELRRLELDARERQEHGLQYSLSGLLEEGEDFEAEFPTFREEAISAATDTTTQGLGSMDEEARRYRVPQQPISANPPEIVIGTRESDATTLPARTVTKLKRFADPSFTPAIAPSKRPRAGVHVRGFLRSTSTNLPTDQAPQCDYMMSNAWKNSVEGSATKDDVFDFQIERQKIEPIISLDENQAKPCLFHLRILAWRFNMITDKLTSSDLTSRFRTIWNISKDDRSPIRVICDKRTSRFFKPSANFDQLRYEHSLGTSRFQRTMGDLKLQIEKADVLAMMSPGFGKDALAEGGDSFQVQIDRIRTRDWIRCTSLLPWVKDEQVAVIIAGELQMLLYHCRADKYSGDDGLVRNMYYSLAQQIARQDPALWLLHYLLREDGEHQLVSFPQCASYFPSSSAIQQRMYQGDTSRIVARALNAITDEICLLGKGDEYALLSNGQGLVRLWLENSDEKRKCVNLLSKREDQTGVFENTITSSPNVMFSTISTSPGDVVFAKSGTPYEKTSQELPQARLTMSSGLLALKLSPEGTEILENGACFSEVQYMHSQRKPPYLTRWEDYQDGTPFPPPSLTVTGLGSLSEALVGRMSWSDPTVQLEAKRWLTMDANALDDAYNTWCERAVAQAKYYWQYLQEFEQSQVPTEKSYFALLNAGRLHEPLQDDAELFGLEIEELQITGGNIPENDDREMGLQASEDEHRKAIPTSTVNEGSPLSPRSHSRGSEERVTKIPDETTPEKTIPVKTPAVKTSAVKKPPMQTATEKKSTRRSNN